MENNTKPEAFKMPEEQFGDQPDAQEPSAHLGIVLGILIVVLALALGGLYVWSTMMSQNLAATEESDQMMTEETQQTTEQENTNTQTNDTTLRSSDDIDAIEADVENTNFAEFDAAMAQTDAEIESGTSAE